MVDKPRKPRNGQDWKHFNQGVADKRWGRPYEDAYRSPRHQELYDYGFEIAVVGETPYQSGDRRKDPTIWSD